MTLPEISKMTVKELRKFAAERGIVLGKARTKGEIIVVFETGLTPESEDLTDQAPTEESEAPENYDPPAGTVIPPEEEAPNPVETVIPSAPKLDMNLLLRAGGHLGPIVGEDQMNPGQQALLKARREAGYHLTQGFFFLRLADGSVRISKNRHAASFPPDGTTPFSIDIDPESWATVLEEMSGQSNSMGLHQAARDLHA